MGTPESAVDQPGTSRGRLLLVVGLLLALLVIVWLFFLRGDDPEEELVAPRPPGTVEVDPTPTVGPLEPGDGPVETFEVFAPKDPFEPLISDAVADVGVVGTGTTTTGTDGTGTGTDGTGTGTDGTGTDGGTGTGGGGGSDINGGGGGSNVNGHRVRVLNVYNEDGEARAQVQVDGSVYTVTEGETFAENFQLVSTSGSCATMLYGDDEFTLCEGEEILK